MSLVAYAASSDEESSDNEDSALPLAKSVASNCKSKFSFSLALPKPKSAHSFELEEFVTPAFGKLPMPKTVQVVEEEDDEFLQKKASPLDLVDRTKAPLATKGPVKITIPSLKEFCDVDKELSDKAAKSRNLVLSKPKGSGLLYILPAAKSEQNFAKSTPAAAQPSATTKPAFIPDTVKNRRPAHNTECIDRPPVKPKKKPQLVAHGDSSEASDGEDTAGGDFFSLNCDDKLPEVSANEINVIVAKRAAKMAEAATKFLSSVEAKMAQPIERNEEELEGAQKRFYEQQLDAEAMQALVGGNAKRRRKHGASIQVMDISSNEVLPNREEWLRGALATSTAYQPTGVLVDEEPAAGTRRKHQITYLAHKAKANEAELQAMWATNRQTRRATQSKYGF